MWLWCCDLQQYVEELEGVAEGSDVSFETIFIENIVEEFSNSIPPSFQSDVFSTEARHPVLRCSDIVLSSSEMHVVAHNEDSGEVDVNRTAIVIAKIAGEPKFVAYTYLGDLPSGAFGFNQNGVAFTLNCKLDRSRSVLFIVVQPSEIFVGGLGRGFISRDLLTAKNANDATAIITREVDGRSSQALWNIEVASFNRHIVYEFKEEGNAISAFFHANQYQRLQIAQPPYQSSLHRLQRYNELTPPTTIDEALVVLGDQEDRSWPVFHDHLSHARGDLSGWTLTTIVFDLDKGKAVSFLGNPAHCRQNLVWDLSNVTMLSAAPTKRFYDMCSGSRFYCLVALNVVVVPVDRSQRQLLEATKYANNRSLLENHGECITILLHKSSFSLIFIGVILAATVDGLADEKSNTPTANVQAQVITVKGDNITKEEERFLQTDDFGDFDGAKTTEERALVSPQMKTALKNFAYYPILFIKALRRIRNSFG
ncbi:Peptidase C45 [Phytophthora cactorum]|nr:Peptidase C45 [Phytophthora cactorum]